MNPSRRLLLLCLLTAGGELGFLLAATPWPLSLGPIDVAFLAFTLGPPVFLGLLVWRRRASVPWPRLMLAVAVFLAVVGLGLLGRDCYRFHTDPQFRLAANPAPLLVPLLQWPPVLAIWFRLVLRERQVRRRTG